MPTYPRIVLRALCALVVACLLLMVIPTVAVWSAVVAQILQTFALTCLVLAVPWIQLRVTLPGTVGKFICSAWFVTAWRAFGKPADLRVNVLAKRHNIEDAASDPRLSEFRYAGALQRHLAVTLALYSVLVIVNALIVLAAFGGGITIIEL